jgi:hypothetical protein
VSYASPVLVVLLHHVVYGFGLVGVGVSTRDSVKYLRVRDPCLSTLDDVLQFPETGFVEQKATPE